MKIGARFVDFSGEERILGMRGDWRTISAKLVIDDEVVAVVQLKSSLSSTVSPSDTYSSRLSTRPSLEADQVEKHTSRRQC